MHGATVARIAGNAERRYSAGSRRRPCRLLARCRTDAIRLVCARDSGAAHDRGRSCKQRNRVETRSEEHTSDLQSLRHLVCRLLLEKKNKTTTHPPPPPHPHPPPHPPTPPPPP